MAVTLADGITIHKSSTVNIPARLFGQSASLHLPVRCHVLDHLSSDLVFGTD